jgi:hypothetical protein
LIVTLILLSVTLVMAVAFLAISRRERGSVATESDTTAAKFAADSALAHAEARIVVQILVTTNPYVQPLLVSTNYYNSFGFNSGVANVTNINYNYLVKNGGAVVPFSPNFVQNVANLYFNPRPPVYYSNDFRYYLDLNRNGEYDTNGVVTNVDMGNQGLGSTSVQIGDPEWIGVLEHPDQPHGPNNQFIARYCYIAVPADSLDLNEIHNQALNAIRGASGADPNIPSALGDAYSRNQGVGTWEINLAAFLADLNPNQWDVQPEPYLYPEGLPGNSFAFDDARSLIAWRYSSNYFSLQSADNIFGNVGANIWVNNGVDGYGVYLQTNFYTNFAGNYVGPYNVLKPSTPWLGAPNAYDYFYSPSELFDPVKSSGPFVNRIYNAGTSNDTYDRYTFYRMLGQIGSESAPETDKININYSNAVVNCDANGVLLNLTVIPNLETNFAFWQPQTFFTAAADKMLHAYSKEWYIESPSNFIQTYYGMSRPLAAFPWTYFTNISGMQVTNVAYAGQINQIPAFGITNIPVFVNGSFVYTPAVNRVLQLAANIYDASTWTNYPAAGISNYPSVFRPVFWKTNEFNTNLGRAFTDVYIKGYQYIFNAPNGTGDSLFAAPIEVTALPFGISVSNVWGVPWIIGAKKGFPNLDKIEVENNFFIERLLQVNRDRIDTEPQSTPFPGNRTYTTNQMYIMGVSNYFGLAEANNYAENYNNPVAIVARDTVSMGLTWTNDPIIGGGGSSVVNTYYGSETNVQTPFQANSSVMLLGRNLFNYSLTAGSYTLNSMNTSVSLPFVLNDANIFWTTNSSFVYYYGPGSKSFSGVGGNGGSFTAPAFIPTFLDPSNYLDTGTPQLPEMTLFMTNRLQAFMIDSNGKILDYVQLGGMDSGVDVNQNLADNSRGYTDGMWSTNGFQGGGTPFGVAMQVYASSTGGHVPAEDTDGRWADTPVPGTTDTGADAQRAFFSAFFSPLDEAMYNNNPISNLNYSIQAPYTPIRVSTQRFIYEANDPLVHYISSDLTDPNSSTNGYTTDNPILSNLTAPNDRRAPWGTLGQTVLEMDQNVFNLSYKDPLVGSADNWDFPTNKFPSVGWLGRVHRGTPWQSVYLKSSNILALVQQVANGPLLYTGTNTWVHWTGNLNNYYDAQNMAPVQDRLLFDLFTATPNDDATRGQLSVNVSAEDTNNLYAGLAAWSSVLSGVTVFSNNVPNGQIGFGLHYQNPDPIPSLAQTPPRYANLTVRPAGFNLNSPVGQIVQGINRARTNFVAIDGLHGVFEHVGDVLAAPQLADISPLLNTNNMPNGGSRNQAQNGISDEMYEWVPQQIMGLLTVNGTPQAPQRYVVYCYGQTLKPAPNGIVTSGTFFGLVTNYQVTAETGTRAIIRVDNTPTPANPTATPHIVVEQYNPLPPD